MRTSNVRTIAIEAGVATAVTLAVLAAAGVPRLGLGHYQPHPIWIPILVIAARYGGTGLLMTAVAGWGGLAVAAALSKAPAGLALQQLASPPELIALATAVVVGWVASVHERRARATAARMTDLERRAEVDGAAVAELRRAAMALRTRNDRLDLSLTFLRDVARRLEGADFEAAAQAAMELCVARLGARAVAVQLFGAGDGAAPSGEEGGLALETYAASGLWNPDGEPATKDGTVLEVARTGRPVRALDLPTGGPADSDLAAPLVDGAGKVLGVLAARGLSRGGAGVAALRDLAVVADWCGRALARERDATLSGERSQDAGDARDGRGALTSSGDFSPASDDQPRSISRINA